MGKMKYNLIELNEKFGQEIVEKYKNGAYARDLSVEYLNNANDVRYIYRLLKLNGVQKRSLSERAKLRTEKRDNPQAWTQQYKRNSEYFENWSYNMAYILGLLATDGTNSSLTNIVKITLQEGDSHLLEEIKEELEYEGPIYHSTSHSSKYKKDYPIATFQIRDKKISEDVYNLGIVDNKTFVLQDFSFIPTKFQKAFILGIIDGDGGIDRICGDRCKNSVQIRVRFCSAAKTFIEGIRDMMHKNGFSEIKVHSTDLQRKNTYYTLEFSTSDIINYLSCYENVDIFLNRKLDKILSLIEERIEYENTITEKWRLKINITEQFQEYNITKSPHHPDKLRVEKVRQTESEMTD